MDKKEKKSLLLFFLASGLVAFTVSFVAALPHYLLYKESQRAVEMVKAMEKKPYLRGRLYHLIKNMGRREHQRLVEVVGSDTYSRKVRLEALLALVGTKSPYARRALLAATYSDWSPLYNTALQKLASLGREKAVYRLMEMIDGNYSEWTKSLIVKALESIVKGKSSPPGRYSKEDLETSILVWKSWWEKNRHRSILDWYLDIFKEEDTRYHQRAVEMIGRLGLYQRESTVIEILHEKGLTSGDPQVRIEALRWLNRLHPTEATTTLLQRALRDPSEVVRHQATVYLIRPVPLENRKGHYQRPLSDLGSALEKLIADPYWKVRHQICIAMGDENYRLGIPLLLESLQDSHRKVRYAAARALYKMGRREGVRLVARDLDDPKHRRKAIVFLRSIYSKSWGLSPSTPAYELEIIARRWKRFLENKWKIDLDKKR